MSFKNSHIFEYNPAQTTRIHTKPNISLSQSLLSYQIQKFNSKLNVWFPMLLQIEGYNALFYEYKKRKSPTPTLKEHFPLIKVKLKFLKHFKQGSTIKSNVLSFQIPSTTLSSSKIENNESTILVWFPSEASFTKAQKDLSYLTNNTNTNIKFTKNNSKIKICTGIKMMNRTKSFGLFKDDKNTPRQNSKNVKIIGYKANVPKKQRTRSWLCVTKRSVDNSNNNNTNTNTTNNDYKSRNLSISKKAIDVNGITEKEENTTLISLLNQMIISNSSNKNKKTKTMRNIYNTSGSIGTNSNSLGNNGMKGNIPLKRKEQIDKIINLSLINENNSHIYPNNNSNDNEINHDLLVRKNIIDINSTNSNKAQEDSVNVVTLGNNEEDEGINAFNALIAQIDNYRVFAYDPFVLRELMKRNALCKKDIGRMFIASEKDNIKSLLLIEIIALLSKKFLFDSVTKSLEVVLKEKEINANYFTSPSHPHSIEYCICDIFNTFLSKDLENIYTFDLYFKVLPLYLKESFKIDNIDLIRNLNRIREENISALFVSMQYHNKVSFTNPTAVNFSLCNPFKASDIKYISPYAINKWHLKAREFLSRYTFLSNSNKSSSDINYNIINASLTTTNVKRMKPLCIETKDIEEQTRIFKLFEYSNNSNRLLLVKEIYNCIVLKQFHSALKLCDYYIQKYTDTIFLNSIVYMYLAEIYNELYNVEYAKMFFQKALSVLNWLYPNQSCHFIFELYYNYMLILMKQKEDYIKENIEEIKEVIRKCGYFSVKFFGKVNYKVKIQVIIFQLSYEKMPNQFSEEEIREEFVKINECMSEMEKEGEGERNVFKGEELYWSLFIDMFKGMKNTPKEIVSEMIKKLCGAKKKGSIVI